MIAALIIVFREIMEAGLIVGIMLAVTRSLPGRGVWIGGGLLAGLLGCCVLAAFTGVLASLFEGSGQELFNAAILALAVVMLGWHNIWMAKHGRAMAGELKAAGEAVAAGSRSMAALAIVVGVAVLREGAEAVLFLYGIVVSDGASKLELFAGGILGLGLGVVVSVLTYLGMLKIPPRYIFTVTSTMIAFLTAGMAAQAVAFLEKAGWIEALSQVAWNSSSLLSDKSLPGRVLHTLIGYNDQPTIMQVLVYIIVLFAILGLTRMMQPGQPMKLQAA